MTCVIAIGECMVERRPGESKAFAGDAFNVAAHIKQAAPEISVAFATATSEDAESARMRASWRRFGIDGSLSPAIAGGRIGAYVVETDAVGERRFTYDRADSAARRWFEELAPRGEAMAGADLIFLTGVSLAILPPDKRFAALSFVAGLQPEMLAFDPNVRPSLWESPLAMRDVLEAAMEKADILLPSRDDLVQLWGDGSSEALLERCCVLGPPEVALTLGAEGCRLCHSGRPPLSQLYADGEPAGRLPAPAAKVVDTAGAGDAFDGAYLAARLQGKSPEAAANAGLERAALTVARSGALPMELFPCP